MLIVPFARRHYWLAKMNTRRRVIVFLVLPLSIPWDSQSMRPMRPMRLMDQSSKPGPSRIIFDSCTDSLWFLRGESKERGTILTKRRTILTKYMSICRIHKEKNIPRAGHGEAGLGRAGPGEVGWGAEEQDEAGRGRAGRGAHGLRAEERRATIHLRDIQLDELVQHDWVGERPR